MSLFRPQPSPVASGAFGFVTIAEADAYFTTRYAAELWAGLDSDEKSASLQTAYMNIVGSPHFVFEEDTVVTDWLKHAQCEQALYVVQQGNARDARMGIQAQNVSRSEVVREYYRNVSLSTDICAAALSLLNNHRVQRGFGRIIDLGTEYD